MADDDSFAGLSPDQQLAIIAAIGLALIVAGETMSTPATPDYDPLVWGLGFVCLLYVAIRFAYERLT